MFNNNNFKNLIKDALNETFCTWWPMAFKGVKMPWRSAFGSTCSIVIKKEDL